MGKKKLKDLFPFLPDIEFNYSWSGKIAMTKDHIPKIVNFNSNALSCFGYSGRGIAPGTFSARLVPLLYYQVIYQNCPFRQ